MDTLWNDVLTHIQARMNPSSFTTWFSPTRQIAFQDNILYIAVPDKYFVNWLEEHYLQSILDILHPLTGPDIRVNFLIDQNLVKPDHHDIESVEPEPQPTPSPALPIDLHDPAAQYVQSAGLNPKYTFETYVVGDSNRFAHAASLAVAEQPSRAYNPLFIYGGVGLGKTHLMHAIGHAVKNISSEGFRLYYLSFERFMNELINAIRYDTMQQFRDKYRNIDLLLIDDIQFIAGKERTQEEFFHTFNALYDAHKQIVISSDCPPKKIPTLEERLRSRFEWGLIVDIQPPDLETKIAILKKKAAIEHIRMPDEVAIFIASKVTSNIRALEGCLVKVAAHANLTRAQATVELARKVLGDILETSESGKKPDITIELVQEVVANYYKITVDDMNSTTRVRTIAFPRQIAMYLARKLTEMSLPAIGQHFGGKDHTTIMHACQKIETLRQNDFAFQKELDSLEERIAA